METHVTLDERTIASREGIGMRVYVQPENYGDAITCREHDQSNSRHLVVAREEAYSQRLMPRRDSDEEE